MKKLSALLIALFALPIVLCSQTVDLRRTIAVNGEAQTTKAPDTFEMSISFGESKEFLGKQNIEKLEDQIIQILKKSNIDVKKDVKTVSSSNRVDDKTVYIQKTISLSVTSFAQFYAISKDLDFKGIQRVWLSQKYYSKHFEVLNYLRAKARENALQKAQALLAGSDAKVGKILTVTEGYSRGVGPNNETMADYAVLAKSAPRESIKDIEDIRFFVNINVTFEIIDK